MVAWVRHGDWAQPASVLSSVLVKEVALSVQHGCTRFPMSYQSPFDNFQTGLNVDATDDSIASAIAGGSVAPLV